MSTLPKILFALLLAMCALVGAVLSIQETPFIEAGEDGAIVKSALGHGTPHAKFSTMKIGGSGETRHSRILWLGWAFGLVQICFFVGLLALSSKRQERSQSILRPLGAGLLLYAGVFTVLILSYRHFMGGDSLDLVMGLPRPTAWMIYGLWTAPVWFLILYIKTFKRSIWTGDDQKRFEQIIEAKRHENGEGD